MSERTCVASDCGKRHHARGLCAAHYQRLQRTGEIQPELPIARSTDDRDEILRNIRRPNGESGCWYWRNRRTGYATIRLDGVRYLCHRLMYEWFRGPIPPESVLDHLCHNADPECPDGQACRHRGCVNPWHLEAVRHEVNILRGHGLAAQNVRKTHCPQGHPYSGVNLIVRHKGGRPYRVCRRCEQDRNARRSARPRFD